MLSKFIRMHAGIALGTTCALLIGGCAGVSDNLRVAFGGGIDFIQPPRQLQMTRYTNLVIHDDGSPDAHQLGAVLAGAASASVVQGKPYFTVLQNTSALRARAGLLLDVGPVQVASEDTYSHEQRRMCRHDKPGCDDNDKVDVSVPCLTRTVTATGSITAIDAGTRRVVFVETDSASTTSVKQCIGDDGTIPDRAGLRLQARQALEGKLVSALVPQTVRKPIDLVKSIDGADPRIQARLALAWNLATNHQVPQALQTYQDLLGHGEGGAQVAFNAGYCEQALGDFAAADADYRKALALGGANSTRAARYQAETAQWLAMGVRSVAR